MKKILLLGFAVALTAGIVTIPNGGRTDVVNAQLLDLNVNTSNSTCPTNKICVWSKQQFEGVRSIYRYAIDSFSDRDGFQKTCVLILDNSIDNNEFVNIGRSIRNNSPCRVLLYIQGERRLVETGLLVVDAIAPNTSKSDSGEFRQIEADRLQRL
ncbi:MAG: peptidase inhibitor family I36 protein [Desmonostoc geniculatum HA4340-LM1]|jgi:hypothetical protein|nr:peptidase inhibitor family I36 protein [Desmonostoc geniculatum HA4340-LM1]